MNIKDIKKIEKSMFCCDKLNAKITPQTCINNQKKQYANRIFSDKKYQFINPCSDCEQGKKILPDEIKNQEIECKICRTWEYNPDLCKGYNNGNGIFYRKYYHSNELWQRKKHCNDFCYRAWYREQLKLKKEKNHD